jgi:hypothetical protein
MATLATSGEQRAGILELSKPRMHDAARAETPLGCVGLHLAAQEYQDISGSMMMMSGYKVHQVYSQSKPPAQRLRGPGISTIVPARLSEPV